MCKQVPGVVSYPNLTSQATLVSGINVTSFLTQDFALDLTSAERQLLSNYSYTYPKVVVRGGLGSLQQSAYISAHSSKPCCWG